MGSPFLGTQNTAEKSMANFTGRQGSSPGLEVCFLTQATKEQEGALSWAFQPGEVGRQQGKLLSVAKFVAQIQSCRGSSEGSPQEARL